MAPEGEAGIEDCAAERQVHAQENRILSRDHDPTPDYRGRSIG